MKNKFSILIALLLFVLIQHQKVNAQQWGDYTLYATQNGTTAVLVDTFGNTYHTWTFGNNYKTGYSSYLLPGGDLLRTVAHVGNSFNGGGMTGEIQKVDWSGNVLWDYVYSTSTNCIHHDICPMPNGNVLLISYETKTISEVTQAGSSTSHVMWPDKIVEIQPSGASGGTEVWAWHAWDHLMQNADNTKDNYVTTIVDHPELLNINYNNTSMASDWLHMNGLDYNATLDQIIVSSHFMNEFYVLDHSTTTAEAATHTGGNSGHGGDILYRWGNPAAYQASGTAIFNTVHDAHWVPADCPHANWMVGYNNNGVSMSQSSVDMVNPPYNGYNYTHVAGQAYTPSTYTFRHPVNGHNTNMGNSQQLPNGNMLVCVAQSGYIYEIDSNQNVIWSKQVSGTVPQAFRYSACYVSGTQPATASISQNGNVLTASTTGTTYQWYLNGVAITGATSQTYTASTSGNYQVIVKDDFGCSSQISLAYSFVANGISDISSDSNWKLSPNPSSGFIAISNNNIQNDFTVEVFDVIGNKMMHQENATQLDLSSLSNGCYMINIENANGAIFHSKILLNK